MRAALRSIDSYDVDDLATWQPDGPNFAVMMRLLVGPSDGPREESFDVVVCTGGWLASMAKSNPRSARYHTVVDSFDWPALRLHFEQQVEACTGQNWVEVAQQLSRIGY